MAYVILSRRGRLGSTWPSGSSRKSTPDTPISAAAARCSPVRRSASWRGSTNGSSLPLSPRVTRRYRTSAPPSTQRATVPAAPNSMSSGRAATTSTRSGAGNRSIAIGQVIRVAEEDDLSLGTQCVQDREKRRTSLAVRLGSDFVEDERRRLIGSDQVLSHGRAQQQVDLLTRALGEQPGFSPDARPRLLDLDRQ